MPISLTGVKLIEMEAFGFAFLKTMYTIIFNMHAGALGCAGIPDGLYR